MKAARTREQIVDVAIGLFVTQGYEQTTMEQIAEGAEVAPSTLYRYFPSKELLVLDRFLTFADMGDALRARPVDEPVAQSLTIVIRDSMESIVDDPRGAALRRILDEAPAPRARLIDIGNESRSSLEKAIADRIGLPPNDLRVMMASRTALSVYEIVAERWWAGDHSTPRSDVLYDVVRALAQHNQIIPAPLRPAEN